jgi:hypothetical protein
MRNSERIAGLAELSRRWANCVAELRANRERCDAYLDGGSEDPETADRLCDRTAELLAERDALLAELRRLDPAFGAEAN